jgi:hypothetical protein
MQGVFAAQRAVCLAHAGRLLEARAIVCRFLDDRPVGQADDETPMPVVVALLETAVRVGDKTAVERLIGLLAVASGLVAVANSLTVIAHLGAAMASLGDRQQALTYTEQARDVARRIGFRPELALATRQRAELLLAEDVNSREGAQDLDFARDEFQSMQMASTS